MKQFNLSYFQTWLMCGIEMFVISVGLLGHKILKDCCFRYLNKILDHLGHLVLKGL